MGLRLSAPVEPGQEEGLDISAIDLTDNTNPAFALGPRPSFQSGNCRHVCFFLCHFILIEFILPFAYSIAGSAGTRTNSRAIFEQTLSS